MKRLFTYLISAASVFAVWACNRAEMEAPVEVNPDEVTTLTLSFENSKTTLVEGKTTWVAGDKVRIYNATGTFYEDVVIPVAEDGASSVKVEVSMSDKKFFAVYPATAADGISSGKVGINIPSSPDGRFASANICVAETTTNTLSMVNATAILKLKVESGGVIELVQFIAKNNMVGKFSVDLSGEAPKLTAKSAGTSVTLPVGGVDGDYFIAVAPGTYAKEFAVTALKGNGGYQTIESSRENEVLVNTIVNLGSIGDNLSDGLTGDGTESSPYHIRNMGEYGAFVASVNLGNAYAGKYISLDADIEDARTPVGFYSPSDGDYYFEGTFLGNNHTVTLNIDGTNAATCKNTDYVGMFAQISSTASIKDLKVAGSVTTTGSYAAGIVGYVDGRKDSQKPLIENCSNAAKVEGATYVAGIAGHASYADIVSCSNSGSVTGDRSVGGIAGYLYGSKCENVLNSGEVVGKKECGGIYQVKTNTWNSAYWYNWDTASQSNADASLHGIGGIVGFGQNVSFDKAKNEGPVTGVTKVGGIVGGAYVCSSVGSINAGTVTASSKYAGGIAGWVYVATAFTDDTNTAKISSKVAAGGIIGMFNALGYSSENAVSNIRNANNSGEVEAIGKATFIIAQDTQADYSMAGGIIGFMAHNSQLNDPSNRRGIIHVLGCSNSGSITGASYGVGGLVGLAWSWFQCSTLSTIQNSSNSGNVTGYCRVGGILGEQFDRWIQHGTLTLRNLVNTGDVTATIPTGTSSVGGIVGRSHYHSTATTITAGDYGTKIENCLNLGRITYAADDNKSPYAGGIGGYFGRGYIKNCVNGAFIGPKSGKAPVKDAEETLGAIAGQLGTTYTPVSYAYYGESTCGQAFGKSSKDNTIIKALSYDVNYQLKEVVTFSGKDYDIAADALNAWVNENSTNAIVYYPWKIGANGPEFAN